MCIRDSVNGVLGLFDLAAEKLRGALGDILAREQVFIDNQLSQGIADFLGMVRVAVGVGDNEARLRLVRGRGLLFLGARESRFTHGGDDRVDLGIFLDFGDELAFVIGFDESETVNHGTEPAGAQNLLFDGLDALGKVGSDDRLDVAVRYFLRFHKDRGLGSIFWREGIRDEEAGQGSEQCRD